MSVPGMAMHHVDVGQRARHLKVSEHCFEELRVPGILRGELELRFEPSHLKVVVPKRLIAEAKDLNGVDTPFDPGQFPSEVLNMNSRAPVDVRGILVRQDRDAHRRASRTVGRASCSTSSRMSKTIIRKARQGQSAALRK